MRKKKQTKQSAIRRHKVLIALGAAVILMYGAAGYKMLHRAAAEYTSHFATNPNTCVLPKGGSRHAVSRDP
jgi:hypothetical protein